MVVGKENKNLRDDIRFSDELNEKFGSFENYVCCFSGDGSLYE